MAVWPQDHKYEFWVNMKKIILNWIKNEEAATAVEFALVAVPFSYILMGIIEMSLMFASMSTLDAATNQAARMIRTGQVQQTEGDPETLFRDTLCAGADVFLNCEGIRYEVINMEGFSNFADYPVSFDEDGNMQTQGFDAGGVNDVILIRTSYKYPLMTPLIGQALADGINNTKVIMSTIVLETEPYDVQQVVGDL